VIRLVRIETEPQCGTKPKGHMKIDENGKLVFELAKCTRCDGTRVMVRSRTCPLYGKPQRGKPCPHCGATTKSHHWINDGTVTCHMCEGTGMKMEDGYSYTTDEVVNYLKGLPVEFHMETRVLTSLAGVLGIPDTLTTCVDYGQLWKLCHESQERATEHIRDVITKSGYTQARSLGTDTPRGIAVTVCRNGYYIKVV